MPLKPEVVNSYLESVSSSTVDSRKRISDLVSRPQVKLADIFDMVPRGTFIKYNIDIDSAFASPLSGLLSDEVNYSDLLKYGNYDSLAGRFSDKTDISYKDAAYVLKFNTEYPVSDLDSSFMNEKVDSNYKRACIIRVDMLLETHSRNNNIYTNVLLEVKGYRTPFPLFRGVHWVNILFRAYEGCQLN